MFTPSIATEIRQKIESVLYEGRVQPRHTEYQHFYEDTVDGEIYPSVTTKTGLLSREYYKQMAADKAVDHVQSALIRFNTMEPEEITAVFTYAREAHKHDLNRAGEWGTHAHDIMDRYTSEWIRIGVQPSDIKLFWNVDDSNEGKCASLAGEKFMREHTLFPIVSEKKVLSKKNRYAGTLDSLFLVGEVYKKRIGETSCNHQWFEKGRDNISCVKCGRQEKLILTLIDIKSSNKIYGRGTMGKIDYTWQVLAYGMALKELCGVNPKRYWILQLNKQVPEYNIGYVVNPREAYQGFLAMNLISSLVYGKQDPILPVYQKDVIVL